MNLVVELIKVIGALALLLHQHSRSLAIDRGYRCQELQQATISSGQGWTRKKEIRSWIACRLEFTSDPTVSETCLLRLMSACLGKSCIRRPFLGPRTRVHMEHA